MILCAAWGRMQKEKLRHRRNVCGGAATKEKTMKKLMVVASAIVMACSLHAANFIWGNQSFDYTGPNGEADYTGGKAFLFLGTVTASATAFDTSSATFVISSLFEENNWVYGNIDQDNLSSSDAVTSTDAGQAFTLIVVDQNVASLDGFEGNYYLYNGTSDSQGVLPGVTPVYYAQFMDNNPIGTWETMGSSVPEPTSGLLLVLGMAGLALKRKRM